jgi:hypothetical protein
MTYKSEGTSHFLQTGMTPRAWRMICYICIGMCVYGLILLMETVQKFQLNRIDRQLQELNRQEQYHIESSSPEHVSS